MFEFVVKNGLISQGNVNVYGSVTASHGFYGTASNSISASYAFTASVALNATIPMSVPSASWVSASVHITNADTASYFITSSVTSASYALSASWAPGGQAASSDSASWASSSLSSSYVPFGRSIVLCSAFTPVLLGADFAEVTVPFDPYDGSSSISWNIKRLNVRTQTVGTTSSSFQIEKSTSAGAFSATTVGTVILPSGSYEGATTGSLGTTNSGDKIRFDVIALGNSVNNTIICEISNA